MRAKRISISAEYKEENITANRPGFVPWVFFFYKK